MSACQEISAFPPRMFCVKLFKYKGLHLISLCANSSMAKDLHRRAVDNKGAAKAASANVEG